MFKKKYLKTKQTIYLLGLISFLSLSFALTFELFGKIEPCELCLWQRWPHYAVCLIMIFCLTNASPRLCIFLILIFSIFSFFLGAYHTAVELNLLNSAIDCSSDVVKNVNNPISLDELLNKLPTRCDVVTFSFLGISMAGWNTLISFLMVFLSFKRILTEN